jgi:ABC-type transport system involved in multi-copper enzyme maturation permease subunit
MRTRKAVALQLTLAVACALLVLVRWPTGDLADLSGARSLQVLRVFGYGLLAGILLCVPAFPATSLVKERIKGTLALLLNSPMRPWSIYLGKLGGVLGFAVILLVMTFPAAAACHLLGGTVVQGGIALLYGILGLAVLQLSALGLLVSSRVQSTDGALRITYGLVLVVCVLTLAPYAMMRGQSDPEWLQGLAGGSGQSYLLLGAASWLRSLSPIPAVMEVLGQADVGSQGMTAGFGAIGRYVLVCSIFTLSCAGATVAALRPILLDRARPTGVITEERSTGGRILRGLLFLGFFDPQRRSSNMSLWINPVMVKEFRSRRFGRLHWIVRLTAACAILSLGLSVGVLLEALTWGLEYIGATLVLLQIALVILFAPSLAAGLVSGERESGSWQLLRMTPLSGGAILRGKLLSVVWPLVLLLCATLPGYLVMIAVEPSLVSRIGRVVICLALAGVFAVLLSAAISTLFRSTAVSTTTAYLALLSVCVAPFLIWLAREAPFGQSVVEAVLTVNPVAAALAAFDTPEFRIYELLPANWIIMGAACLALLVILTVRTWQLCLPE